MESLEDIRKHENGPSVVVASRFDICISQEEDGQDDRNYVPSGEDQSER